MAFLPDTQSTVCRQLILSNKISNVNLSTGCVICQSLSVICKTNHMTLLSSEYYSCTIISLTCSTTSLQDHTGKRTITVSGHKKVFLLSALTKSVMLLCSELTESADSNRKWRLKTATANSAYWALLTYASHGNVRNFDSGANATPHLITIMYY